MVKRYETTSGHLEADETLVEAAARELWEGTGISARRNTLFVCISGLRQIKRRFCVSSLPLSLTNMPTQPHDSDIDCCRWVSAKKILQASNLVRRWWRKVFVVIKAGNVIRWR
ncbi:NUDIX domain-containing protein [Shigella flexneri]